MGYVDDIFQVALHAVNSTCVLLVFNSLEEDSAKYGYFVGLTTGFEAAGRFVTLTSTSVDRLIDINQHRISESNTISSNREDPTLYADRVITGYIDGTTDQNVWMDVFNVTSRGIDSHELVYDASGTPTVAYEAGVSKYGQNLYVHWFNISSGNYWSAFIRERDENLTWGSTYKYQDQWYSINSAFATIMWAQTLINNSRLYSATVGGQASYPYLGECVFYINATGVAEPAYWTGNPPYVAAPELENIDSGLDWVFTNWKYYTFILNVPNPILDVYGNLTEAAIRFNVTTGEEQIMCDFYANNTEREQSYLS